MRFLPGQNFLEDGEEFVLVDAAEETQSTKMDRQYRNWFAAKRPRGRQKRAIASQHDNQIRLRGQFLPRKASLRLRKT